MRHEKLLRHLRSIRLFDLVEKTLEDLFVPANANNVVGLKVCKDTYSVHSSHKLNKSIIFPPFSINITKISKIPPHHGEIKIINKEETEV